MYKQTCCPLFACTRLYLRQVIYFGSSRLPNRFSCSQVEDVINNFEPRARLVSVRAFPDLDRNSYEVSVEFYVVNTPTELVDMSLMLERLR